MCKLFSSLLLLSLVVMWLSTILLLPLVSLSPSVIRFGSSPAERTKTKTQHRLKRMGAAPSAEIRHQSVPLPGTSVTADPATGRLGTSPVYRSASSPDRLIDHFYEGITTVYHNFWLRGKVLNPNG